MKLKQITISSENRHGRPYEVARALGDRDISFRALNNVDAGAFGHTASWLETKLFNTLITAGGRYGRLAQSWTES